MSENKHTPDIKCYRINYNSKYWANVAAKVGNQCSSPVGAVFAVNALCDAYEDIAKQRDELLANAEESDAVLDSLAKLLSETAIALKGEEEALQRHSWHDLPVVALAAMLEITILKQQRDELLAALERFMDSHEECTDFDGFTAQIVSMADYHQAQEAIARAKGEQ